LLKLNKLASMKSELNGLLHKIFLLSILKTILSNLKVGFGIMSTIYFICFGKI